MEEKTPNTEKWSDARPSLELACAAAARKLEALGALDHRGVKPERVAECLASWLRDPPPEGTEYLDSVTTSELIDELDKRGVLRVVEATQRLDGRRIMHDLVGADELRVSTIRAAAQLAGAAVADAVEVHVVTGRKMKTSGGEDYRVAVVVIAADALKGE